MSIAISITLVFTDVINSVFSGVGGSWQVDQGQKPASGVSLTSLPVSFRAAENIEILSTVI